MKRLLNALYLLLPSKGMQALFFIFTFAIISLVNISPAQARVAVQETTGTLTPENFTTFFDVRRVSSGERLFVFVEATSGDLKPSIFLEDLDDKPVQSVNTSADESTESEYPGSVMTERLRQVIIGSSWALMRQRY
jgi:hypothetical protein